MDWNEVINKYRDQICFYVGFDVQQIIPWGTVEDVRKEVRIMIDTFFQNNGRLIIGAGNAIKNDCKLECLNALLDECYEYGKKKCYEYLDYT